MLNHILVTLDGSELAEKAIDAAVDLVNPKGIITLLTIIDYPEYTAYGLYPASASVYQTRYPEAMEIAEKGAEEYVNRVAANLREKGFEVVPLTKTGITADTIVDVAVSRSVDAIVMSTHGRSGFNQWLFGSVTQKVLAAMPCPVYVVPGRLFMKEDHKKISETNSTD